MWLAETMAVDQEGLERKEDRAWWLPIREATSRDCSSDHRLSARRLRKAEPSTFDLALWEVESSMRATPKRIAFPSPGVPCS